MARVGQAHVDDVGARVAQPLGALRPQGLDLGVHAVEAVFLRNADRQALDRASDGGFVVGNRLGGARRVLRVGAGHRAQHDRRVAHGAGERSGLIERGGESHHAPARASPVGRLDADDAGEGGRLADRAAGVARGRGQAKVCGDRGGRAARRAARRQQAAFAWVGERRARLFAAPVRRQPGRSDRAVKGGLVRRAHGELVHVELAEHHRPVAPQVGGDGRLVGRLKAVEDVAASLGVDALGGIEVLDPDRQPLERASLALR